MRVERGLVQEGSDYFLEGVRYAPESVEILQSIGRLRVADAELLGLNPDTAASATLSESFADLDGTSPAVLPPADARPRDALDDGGADAVAADRLAAPLSPAEVYNQVLALDRPDALPDLIGDRTCLYPDLKAKRLRAPRVYLHKTVARCVVCKVGCMTRTLLLLRRWVQPVAPTASYEEEVDDDDALGLVLP